MIQSLKDKIISGDSITRDEARALLTVELEELTKAADEIRQIKCGDRFDICTIINGKSGRCTEDCQYCAQSRHFPVEINAYDLLDTDDLVDAALANYNEGILRVAVVTSGRALSDQEVDKLCSNFRKIASLCPIALCSSNGLLSKDQFIKLKAAGVSRYHNNLETSKGYFSKICTTHTYDEKVATIRAAMSAGLNVCSGGIMGLGESMEDRIDMAFALRELGVKSVPINILNPIKNTPLENAAILTNEEVRRIVAVFRFILPDALLRLAGGRGLLEDHGRSIFLSGANAAISGDMLTTAGISIQSDKKMLDELGYQVDSI